jgi:N-acetylglutamate synthase-like GNAT family acetyltransferase
MLCYIAVFFRTRRETMEIREATESDIPTIVDLLKNSLGEGLMPKSERYWRWKHIENPFGISPVLLCWENGILIGVRAFMRWEWRNGGQVYRALRAVDTATHPNHQGKGIFKKLTLSLVDDCKRRGDHFIFNTPNQQSRPGYIKMGWVEAGKLPIRINARRPLAMLWNYISNKTNGNQPIVDIEYYLKHPGLGALLDIHRQQNKAIVTVVSKEYLKWRYLSVPVAKYVAIGEEHDDELTGLIFGRIKQTRLGRELRITDIFINPYGGGKKMRAKFNECRKSWQIDYITLSGTLDAHAVRLFSAFNFKMSVGPIVTVRSLQLANLNPFENFTNWSPSIGDLELF